MWSVPVEQPSLGVEVAGVGSDEERGELVDVGRVVVIGARSLAHPQSSQSSISSPNRCAISWTT